MVAAYTLVSRQVLLKLSQYAILKANQFNFRAMEL